MKRRRYWFPKPYADFVARLRVPGGILLAAAFLWLATPSLQSLIWGIPVALAGLLRRGWAAGHLAKNTSLATGGPYAYLRNPLYAGTLLVASGLAAASRRVELGVLVALVFGLVYLPVIELEEQHLRNLFPEYAAYAERVPLLWPRRPSVRSQARFSWRLYLNNQEYQALGGFLLAAAVLVWKTLA